MPYDMTHKEIIATLVNDEIWHNKELYFEIVRKLGLSDHDCYDVYSYRSSGWMHAIYISTEVSLWESFREAFAYCMIRKLFVTQNWIKPNQKLSSQCEWVENDFEWMNRSDLYLHRVCSGGSGKLVRDIDPHEIDISDFNAKSEFNLGFKKCSVLDNSYDEYWANKQDRELVAGTIKNGSFISLYWDSYSYERLRFGVSGGLYILIETGFG